jgi:hypothetical protein
MLATDLRSPVRSTLARIPDKRASQFWDPQHLVSQELRRLADQSSAAMKPNCCIDNGFFWDDAIVFAPNSTWRQASAPIFWNGQIVRVTAALEKALHIRP